jgi:hypothetical protein
LTCTNGESDPAKDKHGQDTDKSDESNYKSRLRPKSSIRRTQKVAESPDPKVRAPKKRVVLDDHAKLGTSGFVRRTSSVGAEFQVTMIPTAGTYLCPTNDKSEA